MTVSLNWSRAFFFLSLVIYSFEASVKGLSLIRTSRGIIGISSLFVGSSWLPNLLSFLVRWCLLLTSLFLAYLTLTFSILSSKTILSLFFSCLPSTACYCWPSLLLAVTEISKLTDKYQNLTRWLSSTKDQARIHQEFLQTWLGRKLIVSRTYPLVRIKEIFDLKIQRIQPWLMFVFWVPGIISD